MKNTLLTLKITICQFLLLTSFFAYGQCNIEFPTVEVTACEGDLFDVSLDFEYENTSDQFDVTINGAAAGTFNYGDLPVTITSIESDCLTEYAFVITDSEDETCSEDVLLPLICCEGECEIFDLVLTTSECDGGVFDLTINFDFMWGTSSTFYWEIPGVSGGTAYFWELPLTVQVDNDINDILGFVVGMTGETNCASETSFENPCSEPACFIGVVFTEITDCIDGEFGVDIDFQYSNTSDQFTVAGNGMNYGTFSYGDLPITIDGLDGDCTTEYEFVVTDVNNNDCSNFAELGTVCCNDVECELFDLVLETTDCIDGTISLTIEFEYVGADGGYFDWEIAGTGLFGTDLLALLPLTVGIQNVDDLENFVVYINITDDPACLIEGEVENPCFEPAECFIGELDIEVSECDGNEFFVAINFEYENTSDEFFVNSNGNNYGPFLYTSLPVTIEGLESNCEESNEFQVYDSQFNGTCTSEANIGIVCCDECNIISIDFGDDPVCVDGFVVAEWFIFSENTSEIGFDIYINDEFNGFLPYNGEGPYDIEIEDPTTFYFTMQACDSENPDCCYIWEVQNPCVTDECEFLDLVIETSECDGGFFEVTFDFDYSGNINSFFDWEIPGYSSGIALFTDLPLTLLIENTSMNGFDLFISENDNPDCVIEGSFENPCFGEECFIGELDVEVSECDGNMFFVVINFEYVNTSDQFTVNGNGNSYGTFSYSDLPITIDGLESDCNLIYEFVVHDVNNNDCASDIDIGEVCCEGDCEMTTLDFGSNPACEDGLIVTEWLIDGVNISEVGFDIFINDVFETFVQYNSTDWYDFVIENPGTEYFNIKACDNDNPDCCIEMVELMNPCFDPLECDLFDLVIETSDCDGGFFEVTFDFEYTGTTNNFFDWEIPGYSSGFAEFGDLPLTLLIENTSMNGFDLFINENDNPDCAVEGSFENPCFDTGECFIGELNIDVSECEDNMFYIVLDFDYQNTSDEFFVNSHGENYGPFMYSNLPIEIEGFDSNCDESYEFLVYDSEQNGTCESEANIGVVCCDNEGCFIGALDVEVSECDGDFFFVTINFEYENTSDQFTVAGNGNNYGTFSYADLPIVIEDLESSCDFAYEFVVHDVEFNDCASDVGIGEVCCDEEECEIVSIDFGEDPICEEGFIVTEWLILGENISEVGFDIFINEEFYLFVEYNESNWYDFDIENPGTQNFTITACDNDNADCCFTWEVPNPCFEGEECDLFDLNFDVSECDGNFFIVEVDFEYTGNTYDSFIWEIPGIASGTALFEDLPISIEIENSTESQFTFFANEVENQECDIVGTFGNPCYDSEECVIDDVTAEVILCEDDLYDVEIDFEYDNVSNTFSIVGNGVEYGTFEYNDLPVVLTGLEADCALEYEFVVMDDGIEGCSDFVEIGTICCEDFNQINGAQSETIVDGEIFNVTFDITNTTLKGCNIEVYIDGELYQTLGENETLFTVGPFDCGQEDVIEIRLVNSCSDAEWTIMFDLSEIDCTTDVNVTLDSIDLKWNMVNKTLSLDGEVPVSLNVQLINAQGALILAENGVKIGWSRDLNYYPSGLYFVRIVDNDSESSQGLIKKILIH